MAAKTKPAVKPKAAKAPAPSAKVAAAAKLSATANSSAELPRTPPATMEDYLLYIRVLGDRVKGYVDFMCGVEKLVGTSAEAKRKSLDAFYTRLSALEQELGRVKEELLLG